MIVLYVIDFRGKKGELLFGWVLSVTNFLTPSKEDQKLVSQSLFMSTEEDIQQNLPQQN